MTPPVRQEAIVRAPATSVPSRADAVAPAQARLLSIDEACAEAARHARPILRVEAVETNAACGRVLAALLEARIAIPPFAQSAMDGYALAAGAGLAPGALLAMTDRIAAGHQGATVRPGQAVRIFTGAPLPQGADAVIMQEHVMRDGGAIRLARAVCAGDNIRPRGDDVDPPETLLARGERLDARHVGLIAAQGYGEVTVIDRLRVAVVSTGDELRQAGEALGPATIYDSNRPMLLALIGSAGFSPRDGGWVRDDAAAIADRLRELARDNDLVVTSGGASVGSEDHSAAAFALAGGEGTALRIALKPGKPALVGRIGAAAYLGLPGNPVASLVSWLLLGHAMTSALSGAAPERRAGYAVRSASHFRGRPGRTEFVPARLVQDDSGRSRVEILARGGSARLRPLVQADGLAEITPDRWSIEPGDEVAFHPFRSAF